ncbi:MAG: hypothetical protein Q8N31_22180 [Reyranella sp.]|nr:hypothetical protein [Reyranella sp.]MDP3162727.1 hypothetical protein [Reyranella sp.]
MKSLNWLLRGLLGLAGAILVYAAWPVAQGAWQAQKADAVLGLLRGGKPVRLADLDAGITALNFAVAADPGALRRLQRSELVVGAALSPALDITVQQRVVWLQSAEADLVAGLGSAPARGVAWARLASVRQGLQGTSRGVVDALLMSIDTAPLLNTIWPARMRLILDNWVAFTPQERVRIEAYVVMTWRLSLEKRWFGAAVRSPVDELFLRYFLREEPKGQEELAREMDNFKRHGI